MKPRQSRPPQAAVEKESSSFSELKYEMHRQAISGERRGQRRELLGRDDRALGGQVEELGARLLDFDIRHRTVTLDGELDLHRAVLPLVLLPVPLNQLHHRREVFGATEVGVV